ncbi:MAG: AMP-binding protein [Chloroflexota bacterium]
MNLKSMLEKSAGKYAGKTAIGIGSRRVSYADLDEASNRIARALIKMGVKTGDRVAVLLSNTPEFVTTYFGIAKSGGIAALLDTRYKVDELSAIFDNCKPEVLVTESSLLAPLMPALPGFDSIKHVIVIGAVSGDNVISYQQVMEENPASRIEAGPSPDDIATITYTSGPTTSPRGAAVTHRSLITESALSGDGFRQTEKDVVMLFALPMYHMFGLVTVLLTSIDRGSTLVMVPGTGISISSLMETIEREKGTILLGVPYIFALAVKMAKHEGIKNDLSSLRLCGSGGAPLLVSTIREFKRLYGFTIIDFWGQTESISQVTCQPIDGTGKLGASGKALPGWEMKIVDDAGHELTANEPGEIIVRGHFMRGYYNNPQATAKVIRNGWLHTGDLGRIDEDGYLFITGRKKEMIILKGQNVYPSDVETVLRRHPKIAEVKVTGVPDRLRGETLKAIIALKPGQKATEHEIRQFCQQHMADYKMPREILFAAALPQSANAGNYRENLREYLSKLAALPRSASKHNPGRGLQDPA